MVLVQNKYILNLLISTNKIKTLKNLPEIKTLILKVYYKKKTIYLIMTTFFILYFLVDKKPKLSSFDNIKKLELIIIKKKQCFKFLYNFYWLFFKYNNTYASKFNLKCYNKSNIRLFFYSLQNIFFEIFFFKMIQIGN